MKGGGTLVCGNNHVVTKMLSRVLLGGEVGGL